MGDTECVGVLDDLVAVLCVNRYLACPEAVGGNILSLCMARYLLLPDLNL